MLFQIPLTEFGFYAEYKKSWKFYESSNVLLFGVPVLSEFYTRNEKLIVYANCWVEKKSWSGT